MLSARKSKQIVGLDIEAGSIAATQVSANGSVSVENAGLWALGPGAFHEGEVTDPDALSEALRALFAERKLQRNVRLGIANQRIAVRTLRLPAIEDPNELETAVRFQAQDHIPMPLDQAVLEHQIAGWVEAEGGERQMDVVVVAARRDMISAMLGAMRGAGLRPAGIDLSSFGMVRALAGDGPSGPGMPAYEEGIADDDVAAPLPAPEPARLYCNLGDVTNLAVARRSACRFTRISPFGIEGMAQRLAERRGLTLEHARQWLVHVGLERPVEEIEGDPETVAAAREALADGASKLVDELRLSLEFYAAQDGALAVDGVVACGPGTTIPGLVGRLQRDLGQRFDVGRPRALAHLDDPTAARLTLSYGLALEE